ncbi:uncharacterized protein LOC111069632 [Drosophila obscura]|uniref:uncharacterized protein LOC111069632 n=1 Tax=Drosophila obscura TaxID=7282 RepID=UPI001BB11B4E|nr:uncharacterized protein LOC111069632 [Drosophila obscura]
MHTETPRHTVEANQWFRRHSDTMPVDTSNTGNTGNTPPNTTAGALRPVLFVFYTLENVFNMLCMAYHITGFMAVDLEMFAWEKQMMQYCYMVSFYVFMVLTLFQSISVCTGHTPTVCMEIIKSSAAASAFTLISITTMWDAEHDFHLMFSGEEPPQGEGEYQEDKPVHPFFSFMRSQAIASLSCGILYMLHATLMIDVKITAYYNGKSDEGEYMPIPLYVFGRWIHGMLEKYQWFLEFCDNKQIDI